MNPAAFLTVPLVAVSTDVPIEAVDSLFDTWDLPLHEIAEVNWPGEFPDRPDAKFRIAHTGDRILIKFYVTEDATRAIYRQDGHRPWEESCVEFFISPGGEAAGDLYYNLEMSCIGYGILNGGEPGQRGPVPGAIESVRRHASMPPTAFGIREGRQTWSLTVEIPVGVFTLSPFAPLSGRELRANFYKCGDLLPRPHYLSWSPIDTPAPSFHQPGFFGTLLFE
jgi:hypothetical protein